MCPRNNVGVTVFGICADLCSHDIDCLNDEKCCSNGCGHQCMAPYKGIYISVNLVFTIFKCSEAFSDLASLSRVCLTEKPGVCPSEPLGIGLCVEMCSLDSNCPNDEKCCSNGCGHQCMAPYKGIYDIKARRCSQKHFFHAPVN